MSHQFVTAERLAMVCQEWRRDITTLVNRINLIVRDLGDKAQTVDTGEAFRAELRKLESMLEQFVNMANGRMRGLELALEMERGNRTREFAALSEFMLELEDDKVGNLQAQILQCQKAIALLLPIAILGAEATEEGKSENANQELVEILTAWKI